MLISLDRLVEDGLLSARRAANGRAASSCGLPSPPFKRPAARIRTSTPSARKRADGSRTSRSTGRSSAPTASCSGRSGRPRRATATRARSKRPARTQAEEIAFVRFLQWRFSRDFRALRAYAHERGVALIGDIPIFVGPRQRRRLAAPRAVLARRGHRRTDGRRGRAARLLQRDGPALGQPALPLGSDARKTGYAWWIERFRATLRALRRRPPRSLHRLRPLLGDSRPRDHRGERPLARRARRGRSSTRSRARWASCRSSPRISAPSPRRSSALRDALGHAGHQASCSSPSAPIRRRPTFSPTTTRATPSSTPARTTTTRRWAGSTIRGSASTQRRRRPRRSARAPARTWARTDGARDPLADDPRSRWRRWPTWPSSRCRTCSGSAARRA